MSALLNGKNLTIALSLVLLIATSIVGCQERKKSVTYQAELERASEIIDANEAALRFQKKVIDTLFFEDAKAKREVIELRAKLRRTEEGQAELITQLKAKTRIDTVVEVDQSGILTNYIDYLRNQMDSLEQVNEVQRDRAVATCLEVLDSLVIPVEIHNPYLDLVVEANLHRMKTYIETRDSVTIVHKIVKWPFLGIFGRRIYEVEVRSTSPYAAFPELGSYRFSGKKAKREKEKKQKVKKTEIPEIIQTEKPPK